MINWAFGMFWDSVKELMVGTMMSWWPFTTRVGCLMADGEAQQIDLRKSEGADEIGGVVGHRIDRVRGLAGRRGNPRIVEQDDAPMFRKPVGDRGIPVIHSTPKMLHENERHAARLAESAIGEADPVSLDELCRRGLVGVYDCGRASYYSVGTASGTTARAALAQSTSFCTVGAPLRPIAPTTSPFTFDGKPTTPRRCTRKRGDASQKR